MDTIQILNNIVEGNQVLAYLLIFLVTIFEGEVIALSAGVLILLGALNFWVCLLALFCGGMVKTFLGYSIGRGLYLKFKTYKFFKYIEKKVFGIMPHFERKPFWSIFISKFLMINHVVIIFAGYKKVNFKKYLQAEVISTAIWAPSLLVLGYFFSYAAVQLSEEISEFFLIVVLFVVGFFALEKVVILMYDVIGNILDNNGKH